MNKELISFKSYITSIIPMDEKTFNLSLDYLTTKSIKKNDFIIKEGHTCDQIAYIHKGFFRIYHLKNGLEINTCFCKEDSIISSFESLVNNTLSKEYIHALEDSTIVTLSKKNLSLLYNSSYQWQAIGRLLTEKECLRLSNRINTLSFETALEKYLDLIKNQPDIIKRVSVQHIASYLGVSRETLSRIRAQIIRK